MNKFIFAIEDNAGKLHFGMLKAQSGSHCKDELEKRYPKANGMNFFGYTGEERSEDVHIHLATKVVNSTYDRVTLDKQVGKLVTTSTFDPPVSIEVGERLNIRGNTYTKYRVSDGSTISTGRIIDAGSFILESQSDADGTAECP